MEDGEESKKPGYKSIKIGYTISANHHSNQIKYHINEKMHNKEIREIYTSIIFSLVTNLSTRIAQIPIAANDMVFLNFED